MDTSLVKVTEDLVSEVLLPGTKEKERSHHLQQFRTRSNEGLQSSRFSEK